MKKILYIEDDMMDQKAFQRLFKKIDSNVLIESCLNLKDGIELYNKFDFDAIFCDYNLNDGTAVDFLKHNEQHSNKIVIVLTSFAEIDRAVESIKLGAFDFLDKDHLNISLLERILTNVQREIDSKRENAELERKLEENIANTRALVNNTSDAIWSLDSNGRVLIYNLACKHDMSRYFNYAPSLDDLLFEKIPPEFKGYWYKMFLNSLKGETSIETEKVDFENKPMYLETKCSPIYNKEVIVGSTFFVRDVTKREMYEENIRQSEKNFRSVFEGSSLPIIVESLSSHIIIDGNNAAAEMHGYPLNELIGMSIYDTIPPNYLEQSQKNYQSFLKDKLNQLESFVYTKNGEEIPVGVFVTEIFYKSKLCNLIFLQDLTIQRKAEEKLRAAKELADKNASFKSMFLANMSHEIRTPMNAVIGFTDLLLKSDLNDEQREYLSIINESGQDLLVIINEILDISKIQAGKMELRNESVNLQSLFEKALSLYKQKAFKKELDLSLTLANPLPENVLTDGTRFSQILNNLISNGIKFTKKGSVSVYVSSKEQDNHCLLNVLVKDTGIGIAKDKIDSIFEDFIQADAGVENSHTGTGLGLSIVKNMIELMGGNISLNSTMNEGSIFSFQLKLEIPGVNEQLQSQDTEHENFDDVTVLLCEDNSVNVLLATKVLKTFNIEPLVAYDGKEAVEMAKKHQPDLILMDIQMPIMNGIEATKLIREFSNVPIIAVSAHVLQEEKEKCTAVGMNAFVPKPFKEYEIRQALNTFLSKEIQAENKLHYNLDSDSVWDSIGLPNVKELADGDEEFVVSLFDIFIENTPIERSNFILAMEQKNLKSMGELAHKLKSSFIMFEFNRLLELAHKLEEQNASEQEQKEFITLLEQRVIEISSKRNLFKKSI